MNDAIPVGCPPIDDLLGGGVERGTVTQVYGPPAAGKTNLALCAAVACAAAGERVAYIDTEGLSPDRFEDLLRARSDDNTGLQNDPVRSQKSVISDDIKTLSSRIVISEAHTFEEQEEAVRDVEDLAEEVSLIVLDSATGFYRLQRTEDEREGDALRSVARQVTHLLALARKHDLAVLITNQVFSDPDSDMVRALGGNTLEHWTGTVLRIDRFRGGKRRATLEKHRAKPAGESAQFRITDTGLADVDELTGA
ncbi:DNA repair and recombination protein RadB [Halalkalicoccus paucihalophilus]|uniref:DNA repair and recombination protein RadB n=1 Tax=Halalkalicoccus paucihalophilus TaxID=1008153 RepID=A0A151AFE0_9EURY|nr:DNA repair and recombination protein RadB [Halalkalicoccus paucihalophilus]KYH26117.1 DNA repair and recombination protein RadB [Halalkalicoccus paucihalophilus]